MLLNWPTSQLRDLADVRVSNVDKKSYAAERPIRLCNYMDVYANDYLTSALLDFMPATASPSEIERFSLHAGDVVITKDSETPDDIGVPAVIVEDIDGLVCGYHLALIRPKANVHPTFLAKQLASAPTIRYFAANATGSTRFGLAIGTIEKLDVPTPPIAEQAKIAEVLSTVDQAIEETEALITKQQRIKTGLMQDLLTRGIDELGNIRSEKTHEFKDSRLGRIPIEWEVRSMSELTTQIVDGVHHTPAYTSSGVPFIVVSDLTSGIGIDFNHTRFVSEAAHTEYAKRVEPRSGDVLVSKDGTLGVARIVPDGAPRFSIFVSVALLRPKHRICIADLLWSFFESGEFYRQLGALSAGTGLAHIHLEHFRKFQLRCPRVDEQERIFAVITAQSRLLTEYTDALQKLRSVRTALTQDLLTGKRRVTPLLEQCEGVTT